MQYTDSAVMLMATVSSSTITPSEQLAMSGRLVKETLSNVITTTKDTLAESKKSSTGSRLRQAAWAGMLTMYTLFDDVPMSAGYTLVERSTNTLVGAAAVGVLSTTIASALATNQRRRKISAITTRGATVQTHNHSLLPDLISTYGVGSPATVLAYPENTVPTIKRTLVMSSFYGVVGQGLSYMGLETVGSAIGVHPKVALALGIVGATAWRFSSDVTSDPEAMLRIIEGPQLTQLDTINDVPHQAPIH